MSFYHTPKASAQLAFPLGPATSINRLEETGAMGHALNCCAGLALRGCSSAVE